jgi:dipeptidyl aminopeptidase/acylaminoacyl peptidase
MQILKFCKLRRFLLLTYFSAGISAFAQQKQPAELKSNVLKSSPVRSDNRDFSWRELFKIKHPSNVQISPDGKYLLYVRSVPDSIKDRKSYSIWITNINTGREHQWSKDNAFFPRWSPDGQEIAYMATNSHGESQLYIGTPESSESIVQTLPENIGNFSWSPDGKLIAYSAFIADPKPTLGDVLPHPAGAHWAVTGKVFNAKHIFSDASGENQPGHTHVFLVSASGGTSRQLTDGPYNDGGNLAWSRDGKSLYFCAAREANSALEFYTEALYVLQVDSAKLIKLTTFPYGVHNPAVSPDGKTIAFVASQHKKMDYEQGGLYIMNLDGTCLRALANSLDREIEEPVWTSDGKALIVVYGDQGRTKIGRINLDGKVSVLSENIDGDDEYTMSRDGGIAFPMDIRGRPEEIVLRTAKGDIYQLSHLNDSLFERINIATVRPLKVRSSVDGKEIGAWLIFPPEYDSTKKYPLILSIHGGPHGYDTPYWSSQTQLFAAAGYVVLNVDYRGSTSYGFAFASQTWANFPGPAYDDLMSAVDAAIAAKVADPVRLFVTGASAGGQLTAWIIGKTNRFQAAAPVKPVINELSKALTSDQFISTVSYGYPKSLWEDPMMYWQHSPLSLADKVTTPTLLIVGENDKRTPLGESVQFYNALQLRNIPTYLVIVPNASHETLNSKPSQLANSTFMIMDWFSRYGGNPIPTP